MRVKGVLTVPEEEVGWSLEETDDHILYLKYKGDNMAVFSVEGATLENIRRIMAMIQICPHCGKRV